VIAAAPLSPKHTALLLIGAEKYISRRAPVGPRPALEEAATLLRHARRAGAHVLHVRRLQDGEPARELRRHAVNGDRPRAAVLGTGEAVIDTRGASPFADTQLHEDLAARGVEAVIVAGVMTPTSCTATANEALARRYRTVIASELVHEQARDSNRRLGAEVLSSASIRGLLDAAAANTPRHDAPPPPAGGS
jgi:nicotinamidase-related amidase